MRINLQKWYKHFNRPLTLHQSQIYSWSCTNPLKKILGKGIYNQIYVVKNDNADGYFLRKEQEEFGKYILNNRLENDKFLKTSNGIILEKLLLIEKYFNDFKGIDIPLLNDQELLKLFKRTNEFLNTKIAAIWAGFLLGDIIENKLADVLERNGLDVRSSIEIIGAPGKPHHIIQEQLDLMKIVLKGEGCQKNALQKHYIKYRHIPCYNPEVEPYSLSYFENRIKGVAIEDARKFINDTEKRFKNNKKKYDDFIGHQKQTTGDRLFIEYLHGFFFLGDYRSHFRSLAMFHYGRLLREIAGRHNIKYKDISLLLHQEIIGLFTDSGRIKKILEKRKKMNCAYIFKNGEEAVVNQDKVIKRNGKKQKTIKGQSANKGIISGVVKIVLNPDSVNKVKKGDVLVSAMTRPDYVMAIKRASAIITDEGGLLCHAAIVSREMNKPCIVGTKNATQVLKDGDKVRVDANKGIINIL